MLLQGSIDRLFGRRWRQMPSKPKPEAGQNRPAAVRRGEHLLGASPVKQWTLDEDGRQTRDLWVY